MTEHLADFFQQILPKSIAEFVGLKVGDLLVQINGEEITEFTFEEAKEEILKGEDFFQMTIER